MVLGPAPRLQWIFQKACRKRLLKPMARLGAFDRITAKGKAMQTEVLREFIEIAKHSSFRKAANELHVSPPALSNHIASLEQELGFKLFDREGGVRLTEAGAYFYAQAKQVLDLLDESVLKARGISQRMPKVRLQIFGSQYSALTKMLPSIRTPFKLIPWEADKSILEALENDEIDMLAAPSIPSILAHDAKQDPSDYTYIPIGTMEMSFVVSSANPLSSKDSLSLDDLQKSEILLVFGSYCDYLEYVIPELFDEKLEATFVQDPTLSVDANHVPMRGLGMRIMPIFKQAAHDSCASRPGIVAIDKVEGRPCEYLEYIVFRSGNPNANVRAFAEEVRELVGDADATTRHEKGTGAGEKSEAVEA